MDLLDLALVEADLLPEMEEADLLDEVVLLLEMEEMDLPEMEEVDLLDEWSSC